GPIFTSQYPSNNKLNWSGLMGKKYHEWYKLDTLLGVDPTMESASVRASIVDHNVLKATLR
ncbi:MAG: hypothetical protein MJE68_08560, partial [Proteobacteria bacterium]|nr:hypothetical protein [Pseudomonadota bacterium]